MAGRDPLRWGHVVPRRGDEVVIHFVERKRSADGRPNSHRRRGRQHVTNVRRRTSDRSAPLSVLAFKKELGLQGASQIRGHGSNERSCPNLCPYEALAFGMARGLDVLNAVKGAADSGRQVRHFFRLYDPLVRTLLHNKRMTKEFAPCDTIFFLFLE